jgi:CP family cyanate transporter-like MFS transporter
MSNSPNVTCVEEQRVTAQTSVVLLLALLWTSGIALRLTILAVPPLLPLIRADLHLSATAVGVLMSLPIALFALAALPGSVLISRFGTVAALITGLTLVTAGAAFRGLSVNVAILFASTIVMGVGVAILQPTMPALVRQWLPSRVGFGTAVYTNGLLAGEAFPMFLTLPLVLPLVGGSWRSCLAVWSIPVALTAVAVMMWAPRPPHVASSGTTVKPHWSADWKLALRLGILFGTVNSMYFATNAFLPIYLSSLGRADLISSALTAMNVAQIPASLVLLACAGRLERKAWPYLAIGLLSLMSVLGLVTSLGAWTIVCAGLLGFCCAAVMILGLTLPALLAPPREVARTSAAMFTISYGSAVAIAILSGAAWDLSGIPRLAFVPIGVCALTLVGATLVLRSSRQLR